MSWILGLIGTSLSPVIRERLVSFPRNEQLADLQSWSEVNLHLSVGGLPDTCHYGQLLPKEEGNWAVVGLGIERQDDQCTFLENQDWRSRLSSPNPVIEDLDGHFVAVRWNQHQVECFTDSLGVRTLYLAKLPAGIAFSTRLDWVSTLLDTPSIDYTSFGSHWNTFNQLSTRSLIQGVQRLGPGGYALCKTDSFQAAESPWLVSTTDQDQHGNRFNRTLASFLRPTLPGGKTLSLGLSGGLDSRTLLSLGLQTPGFNVHVFGPRQNPDVEIAQRIASNEGFSICSYHDQIPDIDSCLTLLQTHVAQTQVVSAASAMLGLRYYSKMAQRGAIMIDGGFGEVARRQFMNRLLRQGRRQLVERDLQGILTCLQVNRGSFFNADTEKAMLSGSKEELEILLDAMPPLETFGIENLLDLIGIRTRLPNFFGFEQNRLDALIPNYMPFAQSSVLKALFALPLPLRRNARLFRRTIRQRAGQLYRYPFVKGSSTYPSILPPIAAHIWTKAKARLGFTYRDTLRSQFLSLLKPFVLDTLQSQSVRTYSSYDHPYLEKKIVGYYEGQTENESVVDWWLAFEVWRQQVLEKR